jgi:hypothetical protein
VSKKFFPLTLATALVLSLSVAPVIKADSKDISSIHKDLAKAIVAVARKVNSDRMAVESKAVSLYENLGLAKMGMGLQAMKHAYSGFEYLRRQGVLTRDGILTICDFSQSSRMKRLYIIDVDNKKVLMNTYVAHGKNSGLEHATKFSNTPESLQSSLGFYKTKATYFGKHGLSLRLDGLERGWNDKAEDRAVVLHGADYIGAHRLNAPYMGRSFGCPAVPKEDSDKVISLIKNGTCLFIYHPSNRYLHGSRILND